eukprot:scaffold36454_cov176-Amphora_coffeaeformis.AAC.1
MKEYWKLYPSQSLAGAAVVATIVRDEVSLSQVTSYLGRCDNVPSTWANKLFQSLGLGSQRRIGAFQVLWLLLQGSHVLFASMIKSLGNGRLVGPIRF